MERNDLVPDRLGPHRLAAGQVAHHRWVAVQLEQVVRVGLGELTERQAPGFEYDEHVAIIGVFAAGVGPARSWHMAGWPDRHDDVPVTFDRITLPDGRRLSWHEFGDPDGAPVIYMAGTPVSGLGGGFYDESARAAGLRWISPDKPGYGGSDYHRQRSLTSWADDLAVLAGHLGLVRFALAGESGGAPFTLAAAHQLADRVSVVALIAAGGPFEPAERVGLKVRNRVRGWFARNAPAFNAVHLVAMRRTLTTPAKRERILRREMAATPDAAEAGLRIEIEAVADALRPGTRATVQEIRLTRCQLPFPLSEVSTPAHVWHGALDRTAPIAYARRLARELPDATLHVSDSSGHDVGVDRREEIMQVLASQAR
jgi:pimeloyl-ACP methyl ester carboxylesterase